MILNEYGPHICILTGVGAATRNLPEFPGYSGIAQIGTNAFGGVAMLYQKHLKYKIIENELNFILTEVETPQDTVLIGAVYVPPGQMPPFQSFNNYKNRPFYILGDFNAKHTSWKCEKNNTSGVHLQNWLEETGCDIIAPKQPTSRRSAAIIDFGITHDASEWNTEVL